MTQMQNIHGVFIYHMYSYVHDISCTGVVNILCICIAMYTKYVYIYTIIIHIHIHNYNIIYIYTHVYTCICTQCKAPQEQTLCFGT